jgi:DNA-binding GntR family transcriptional regulator
MHNEQKKSKIPVTDFPLSLAQVETGKPLYLCVYDAIYSTILQSGRNYMAGTSLPSESELAEAWDVSKGTIREALYHLLEDGVIQKSQGRRAVVSQMANLPNFNYQTLVNPIHTFCSLEIDRSEIEFHCVSLSNWLSGKLQLSEGSVLVKGCIQYYSGKINCATTVFFSPFSLLEKESVKATSESALIEFIEHRVYKKAEYAQSSLCLIDEMEDNELPKLKLPLILVEEFLYENSACFMFLRHYLNKDSYRIQTIRKGTDHIANQ